MRSFRLAGLLTCSFVLACGGQASASVSARNANATHAYLEAKLVERRATAAMALAGVQAIEAFAGQLRLECPNVLVGMPPLARGQLPSETQTEVADEVLVAVLGSVERVDHPALARFYDTVRHLRWSNRKLTRLLHSLALERDEQSALPPPPLCADLRFWVASGYTASSPQTHLYRERMRAISEITTIEPEPDEKGLEGLFNLDGLVARRLKPYEDRPDRALARRAFPPEPGIGDLGSPPLVKAVANAYDALGKTPGSIA
jgi:hypothetical protein